MTGCLQWGWRAGVIRVIYVNYVIRVNRVIRVIGRYTGREEIERGYTGIPVFGCIQVEDERIEKMKSIVLSVRLAPSTREAFEGQCRAMGLSNSQGLTEAIEQWVGEPSETPAQRREQQRAELIEAVKMAAERTRR